MNCVANGKLLRSGIFKDIYIQPARNAGGALGSAQIAWYQHLSNSREVDGITDAMKGAYLGPKFSDTEIEDFLKENDYTYSKLEVDDLINNVQT